MNVVCRKRNDVWVTFFDCLCAVLKENVLVFGNMKSCYFSRCYLRVIYAPFKQVHFFGMVFHSAEGHGMHQNTHVNSLLLDWGE